MPLEIVRLLVTYAIFFTFLLGRASAGLRFGSAGNRLFHPRLETEDSHMLRLHNGRCFNAALQQMHSWR